jgi:alpha-L-rhamnosidase
MLAEQFLKIILTVSLLFMVLIRVEASDHTAGPQPPYNLRCEYLKDPMGIDVKKPRFFWVLQHSDRGHKQSAYQLIVSTELSTETAILWDTGKVLSDQSIHVVYEGKPLESDRTYYWKVRYWDKNDIPSPYSRIARFDTGLFNPEDWEGEWIGGINQVRKEFSVNGNVKRGRAFVCGLGYYEMRLNGQKVGNNVLDPGYTTYEQRILYSTYDIRDMLQEGENALGVMLGNGWSGSLLLILQINIEFEGGEKLTFFSDKSWKGKEGSIISDSIYHGEIYDARLETPGWDQPGFDDSAWDPVETGIVPKGSLSAQMVQPIRVMDTLVPLTITQPREGVYVFDMGQNFSGWAEIKVSGPRGTQVRLRYAELLYEDGMINQENLRSARAQDIYILKGNGEEVYEPRFTYHGFRYVELTGIPGVPTLDAIRGKVIHSAVEQVGSFSCSNPILNQLQRLILWGQKTNLHSIPTDCNQRDERMGWLGDAHLTAEEAMMNFDMGAFYTKFIKDIRDVQDKDGTITDTVPYIWGQRPADPAWGAAYPLLCWYMYRYYGDMRILEEHYEGVKKYVEFLRSKSAASLLEYSYYGDWVAIEMTPGSFVSSFYYYYSVLLLKKMAERLHHEAEAKTYKDLAVKIKDAFHKKYFDAETRSYANGTQTANALALFLDLAPESIRGSVFQNLRSDILYKNNTHLTTGILGTKYIMEVLTDFNATSLAYELATQTSYPSWGFMIRNGATTLWELWQNKTGPSMNSHNHPMFGSVGSWLYQALAGIDQDENSAGFKDIVIQPRMVRDLQYASGTIHTPRGPLTSAWSKSTDNIILKVHIPVNSEAELRLPKLKLKNIVLKESGKQVYDGQKFLTGIPGIQMVEETQSDVIIKVGSGLYSFELLGK